MRSRIKEHRRVKVSELVPHELNPRVHSDEQREALQALLGEIGFARSLLAYETQDGRLKLIDGHLRQSELDPEAEVEVEILDVNDEEARKLLLSLDPLAALADYDDEALTALRNLTDTDNDTLSAFWSTIRSASAETEQAVKKSRVKDPDQVIPQQWSVVIDCATEKAQVDLWRRLKSEGLKCRLVSS
jgi:ParB-like nuclease family protein